MEASQDLEVMLRNHTHGQSELEFLDLCSDLYAAIKTLEKLETQYARDNINANTYEAECRKLISHCKTTHDALRTAFPDIKKFMETYSLSCNRAFIRLERGIPATLQHADIGTPNELERNPYKDVHNVTESLITLLDALAGANRSVDVLQDSTDAALKALTRASYAVPKLDSTILTVWLSRLSSMPASGVLNEEESRQMTVDVQMLYRNFEFQLDVRR